LISLVLEIPVDAVEDHGAAGVADVTEIVDRNPAGIHADAPLVQGDELLLFLGHSVIDA
jgi:hypothetical protein